MLDSIPDNRAGRALRSMLREGRLPHALLLEGPEGSGRANLARAAAAAALCEGELALRPCGRCRHCVKVEQGIHPDFTTLDGAGGSRSFHIDAIRQLRGQANLAPNEGRCRVWLLTDCQNMTIQAQNALLKLIEEPPAGGVFLLTALNRHLLLETIQSRVVSLSLEPAEAAQAAADSPEALAAQLMAALAGGREYAALRLLAGLEQAKKGRERYVRVLDAAGQLARRAAVDGGEWNLRPLQAARIVAIMEQAKTQAAQNVGLPLISALLCARAGEAVK